MTEAERMRELVAGYRRAIAPVPDDRVRIWTRLQRDEAPAPANEAPVGRRVAIAVAIAVAVAAGVVLVLGLAGRLAERAAIGPRSQSVDVPAAHEQSLPIAAPREPAIALPPAVPPTVSDDRSSAPQVEVPAPMPRPAPAKPTIDPLRAELALIASASAAIDRGEHAVALRRLDDHATRFPDGALRPEARALRAIALCGSGRTAPGRGEALQILRDPSLSTHHARVRAACGLQ